MESRHFQKKCVVCWRPVILLEKTAIDSLVLHAASGGGKRPPFSELERRESKSHDTTTNRNKMQYKVQVASQLLFPNLSININFAILREFTEFTDFTHFTHFTHYGLFSKYCLVSLMAEPDLTPKPTTLSTLLPPICALSLHY